MGWNKFGDEWTPRADLQSVDFAVRWHYHGLVDACSRGQYYDGKLPYAHALRASDAPDPAGALRRLADIGLITMPMIDGAKYVVILMAKYHLPKKRDRRPAPGERSPHAVEQARSVERRKRCDSGDHSMCTPKSKCPVMGSSARAEARPPDPGRRQAQPDVDRRLTVDIREDGRRVEGWNG